LAEQRFFWLRSFERSWKRLGLLESDWEALRDIMAADPRIGTVLPGGGGARKMRFAPPSWRRGKSGATRIVYFYLDIGESIYLIVIYAKNEQADVNPDDLKALREQVQRLKRQARKEQE
jgi:hypothetical protein